mmetsp:Transcript_14406/g.27396  ORF Transcript_14406/g.27396 Transcript_14406/m.27396 type:complete len:247 (+) Transcript_14406:4247-4987(+)
MSTFARRSSSALAPSAAGATSDTYSLAHSMPMSINSPTFPSGSVKLRYATSLLAVLMAADFFIPSRRCCPQRGSSSHSLWLSMKFLWPSSSDEEEACVDANVSAIASPAQIAAATPSWRTSLGRTMSSQSTFAADVHSSPPSLSTSFARSGSYSSRYGQSFGAVSTAPRTSQASHAIATNFSAASSNRGRAALDQPASVKADITLGRDAASPGVTHEWHCASMDNVEGKVRRNRVRLRPGGGRLSL